MGQNTRPRKIHLSESGEICTTLKGVSIRVEPIFNSKEGTIHIDHILEILLSQDVNDNMDPLEATQQ